MKRILSFFTPFPLHTFFVGIFPCLALFTANISQINGLGISVSLLLSLIFTFFSFMVFRLIIRNTINAAFITSLFLVFFFSYGHLYNFLSGLHLRNISLAHHSTILVFWLVILVTGFLIAYKKRIQINLHKILNLAGVILILFQVFLIAKFYFQIITPTYKNKDNELIEVSKDQQNDPDVYYIILDSYAGEEVLRNKYGYDNSAFLSSLKELGFYIPDYSTANYYTTIFSMLSTFHMDYLDNTDIPIRKNAENINYKELIPYLKNNPVRTEFEKMGYKIVSFQTGYYWLEWNDADVYYQPEKPSLSSQEFENLFINTTFVRFFIDTGIIEKIGLRDAIYNFRGSLEDKKVITDHDGIPGARNRYERLQYTFKMLEDSVEIPGKKFVYVHILSPHEPYVFDEKGNFDPTDKDTGYITQVEFLNHRILEIVKHLIDNSDTPPIIIIQGDHNSLDENDPARIQVLSALFMPGQVKSELYDDITPVNYFRYIFLNYFDVDITLINDVSFIKGTSPYEFIPVTSK
ncbi:MAG TPA: hypothetical protein PK174_05310 [Anaerolineaceae bacterium]|nr:hypothetical protein [Anaerolineaceae bacterium]